MSNNNNSDNFPAFVAMHQLVTIEDEIVRSEAELGRWYAKYDVQSAWFEGGTLYERRHSGRVSELCKADTEDEAYLEMARRARNDESSVWIETAISLANRIEEYPNEVYSEMIEKLREVKNS